jgi:hypothetical protein
VRFPHIVGEFFDDEWRRTYEGRAMVLGATVESALRKADAEFRTAKSDDLFSCTGFGFRFESYLPGVYNKGMSALFRFHEPGIYDSMITLGNDEMLQAIEIEEWRDGVPFWVGSYQQDHFLQIGNVRVGVPHSTVPGLARGLRMLQDEWHAAADAFEKAREIEGYQFDDDHDGVVIGRIHSRMWQALLRFANSHTEKDGEGPLHIFFDHLAALNVFTGRQGMRGGHHLMLETRPRVRADEYVADAWVDVVWMFPPNLFDDRNVFSREAWWPARMAASWLAETLIPAVWEAEHPDRRSRWQRIRGLNHVLPPLELRNWWYEKRARSYGDERPRNREELQRFAEALQSHYSLRSQATFPGEFMRAVDRALLRLVERADLDFWGYLKSKGDLNAETHEGMVRELRERIKGEYKSVGAFGFEWRLRTFAEVCAKSTGSLDAADAEAVASELRDVCIGAQRYNQRLAHRMKRHCVYPK